ncbi:MAG: hypothetical protein AAF329_09530 [Cyanobacteria bacterium P01_A01_bin.17]
MKSIATRQETQPLDALSCRMLEATQAWVFKSAITIEDLPSIGPSALAQQVKDQRQRQQALQFLILMPYLDTKVDPSEVALVNAFSKALNLAPQTLKSLRLVQNRKLKQLLMGYTWRSFSAILPGQGLRQKLKITAGALRQYFGDQRIAQQYQALESLPTGTLGRELYQYYRERNFPLPGERKSLSEFLIGHDLVHLLSGIGTDMEGEITVAGFEAGMSRSQFGFELLLEVILDFHLGLEYTTMGLLEAGYNHLNPDALMQAYARGLQMQFDLLDPAWDFKAIFDQPITELRRIYRIPELPQGTPAVLASM